MSMLVPSGAAEEKLLECIDNGMDVFGTTVKDVIYWRFHIVYNLERRDIPRKPEVFSECIRTFFGERAFHVEAAIVSVIIRRFHLSNVALSDSMTRAIVEARKEIRG